MCIIINWADVHNLVIMSVKEVRVIQNSDIFFISNSFV